MNADPSAAPSTTVWPALPLRDWQDALAGLHLRTQIIGKTRLALAPMQNHYWQVALYVTSRGLTTSPMPHGGRTFEIDLDFLDHMVVIRTSDGRIGRLPLRQEPVADFYETHLRLLRDLGIEVRIWPWPSEIPDRVRFDEDRAVRAYNADAAQRCWRIMLQIDRALKQFRGRFLGKCSPVHFWWGGFDMACTRFSGRRAPKHPGGIPNLPDRVTREAYSHECISAGWWPGSPGGPVPEPAFYAYVYPEPPGCPDSKVRPADARYDLTLREWILPYEAVRTAADPDAALAEFLQSTYEAAADLAGWDRAALERE